MVHISLNHRQAIHLHHLKDQLDPLVVGRHLGLEIGNIVGKPPGAADPLFAVNAPQ